MIVRDLSVRPRVGLCGFFIECNRFSPPSRAADFAAIFDLAGDALGAQLRAPAPRTLPDLPGFVAAMDATGAWEPVPLRAAGAQPGGPVEHAYFEALAVDIEARLRAAAPLDAVYVSAHGAALTTASDDPDGELLERVRAAVGPSVPVVAVFDLHANLSDRMTRALSGLVAYRSNPHVDLRERGEEAAVMIRRLLRDGPGVVERVGLPLVPASTAQLIAPGTPYHDAMQAARREERGHVLNVSPCGGFAFADAPKCGFSVAVTAARGDRAAAAAAARRVAAAVWAMRERFVTALVPLDDAVREAVAAGEDRARGPLILADVADNPGGGGGGNTVFLLEALRRAGARDVVLGVFTDPALAADAQHAGVGAPLRARFNRDAGDNQLARPFEADATVLALSDGRFVGRRGLLAGTAATMGPSALLELGGVRVAVVSVRQQLIDPAQLEALGVALDDVRTLVAKSRGHFRAAFEGFAPPHRILEVDCPGLSTPDLRRLRWTRMPRPIWPLDADAVWSP